MEKGLWCGRRDMLGKVIVVSLCKYRHLIRNVKNRECLGQILVYLKSPSCHLFRPTFNLLPLQTFREEMKQENFDGYLDIRKILWHSWGNIRVWVWCACICVCAWICLWVKGYVNMKKVCKAIEFFTYILYSSFFFQFLGKSFMLWHNISLPQRDCDSLELQFRYFLDLSWAVPGSYWCCSVACGSHSWTQTLLDELFLYFTFHQSWHVYYMCDSESKIHFSVNSLTCGAHLYKEFTQKHEKGRLVFLSNCFSYVAGMYPHASIFIFGFHVCNALL